MRRPARRRMPLLSALILATIAAGLWAWLCAPAASAAHTVAAPRLHAAAPAQVDTADADTADVENPDVENPAVDAPRDVGTDTVTLTVPAPLVGTVPGVAGSRAPPAAR
jgi:hypothetical protein